MTTEIEKKFFETFGIEPKKWWDGASSTLFHYPRITADKVLELENKILLKNRFRFVASIEFQYSLGNTFIYHYFLGGKNTFFFSSNANTRKDSLLLLLTKIAKLEAVKINQKFEDKKEELSEQIYSQVRKIFEV